MKKISLEVDLENNEGTDSPWWLIIDPKQNFDVNERGVHSIAGMITGPFFSRFSAQSHLDSRRHAFSKNAKVYCHSGYYSFEYKNALQLPDIKVDNSIPSGEVRIVNPTTKEVLGRITNVGKKNGN